MLFAVTIRSNETYYYIFVYLKSRRQSDVSEEKRYNDLRLPKTPGKLQVK